MSSACIDWAHRGVLALQEVPSPESGVREMWRLLDFPPLWVVVLVLVPLAAGVAYLSYWRERIGHRPRLYLTTLRFLTFALLCLVLFRPVKVRQQENVEPAEVVLLIDDSASMSRRDSYAGAGATRQAVEGLTGKSADETTRLELARAALSKELLPHLAAEGYQTRLYRFDESMEAIPGPDSLAGRGRGTHIGDALRQAQNSVRGRHVTDFVLVSDGRSTGGGPAFEAANAARSAGLAVHTVVVGDTRPERNLSIELVEAPPSVLEGDQVAISVRVHARGVESSGRAQVVLEELGSVEGDPPRTVATEEVALEEHGDRVVLVAPSGSSNVEGSERRFRLSVAPLPDERMLDDNAVAVTVPVAREKIRVLYIDGYPRYEYRFLRALLLRADERIAAQIFLMSATPDFPQEATQGMPRLERVPTGRRELLDGYDVILLGDLNPYAVSPDPARGEEFVQSLFEFVERGGGVAFLAGEYENPKALAGTGIAKLLPVELDATGALALEVSTETESRPTLESPGNPHEVVRLHPDLDTNRALWEDPAGLRGYYWYFPVERAKPGAQVLLRHPSSSLSGSEERDPILVTGYYPSGRTLFLATDDMTWRWRFRFVEYYHERFWRNAIRWLALGRLKDGDRRFGLEALRSSYDLDERVTLEARVLDEDYRPSEKPGQEVLLAGPEGALRPLELAPVGGRRGVYRGTFQAERPGSYRAWIEEAGARVVSAEFEVVLPSRESANPAPDPEALAEIASLSGGRAVHAVDLSDLRPEFPGGEERREPISSQLLDAWDNWGTLMLALGLLGAEWILRKRHELI